MALFHIARYAGPEAAGQGDTDAEAGSRARGLAGRAPKKSPGGEQRGGEEPRFHFPCGCKPRQ